MRSKAEIAVVFPATGSRSWIHRTRKTPEWALGYALGKLGKDCPHYCHTWTHMQDLCNGLSLPWLFALKERGIDTMEAVYQTDLLTSYQRIKLGFFDAGRDVLVSPKSIGDEVRSIQEKWKQKDAPEDKAE